MKTRAHSNIYGELPRLFFETRQIIRQALPRTKQSDPNEWVRLETLHYIESSGGPTMHELATHLRIKAPSATSLVSHLVDHGLVRRQHGSDRRVVRLIATEQGKEALRRYHRQSEKMMRSAFSTLEEREVGSLCSLLQKLIRGHAAKKIQ